MVRMVPHLQKECNFACASLKIHTGINAKTSKPKAMYQTTYPVAIVPVQTRIFFPSTNCHCISTSSPVHNATINASTSLMQRVIETTARPNDTLAIHLKENQLKYHS